MREVNFNDAQEAMGFLVPQQLRIETEVYKIQYPSFAYEDLMFVDESGDMWDIGSLFYSGDIAGTAAWLAGGGFDMPYADVSRTRFLQQNHLAGIGYEWFLQELKRAEKLGRDLGAEKAEAATAIAQKWKYDIAIRGSAEKNTTGLVNDSSVPAATVAATGAQNGQTASPLWANKTPDQILIDVNEALNAPFIATKETRIANTLLLPTTRMQYISQVRLGTNTTDTILSFLREKNYYTLTTGQPLTFKASRELETAGASNSARMISYDNDKRVLRFYLPGDHMFLPIFQKGAMTWEVPGIMNIGGTEIRLPLALAYRDGL